MATGDPANDVRTLLELATDIHTDLGKLATGLAHAGADPQAVQALQKMDVIVGEVVKVLGAGPMGGSGQHGEAPGAPPAANAAPPPGAEGQAPQGGPPQLAEAAGGPPQGPTPGARPNGFHEASANLQAQLAANHAAAQRALSRTSGQ